MPDITHTSTVTEDQIDHLGHMNVRYYGVNALAGTEAMLARLPAWPDGPHLVHDLYTRHRHEQLLGTRLVVRSCVLDADPGGVRLHHELAPADAEDLAATFVHRVSPTGPAGELLAVPDAAVSAARRLAEPSPPYAATRSIDLRTDPLASLPSLAEARARGLQMRKERTVSAEECDEQGRYRTEASMMLLWGGEPADGIRPWGPELYEAPGGELMGWAAMETRVQLRRLPPVGTRIESFGATIALHDRATHRLNWCYRLDSGEALCAFETVDVAFDTRARRAMVIPEPLRQEHAERLHADLAARPRTAACRG